MKHARTPAPLTALLVLAAGALCAAGQRAKPGRCVIKIGGKRVDAKTHAIVLPDRPTLQEKHAAGELQAHIEKLTGQAPPLVADAKLGKQIPIVVGKCAAALKKLGVKIDFAKLGPEGIVMKTKGPALILAGNRRGVLYAVYTFLEDYCNCRWFTPDCTVIPKTGTFDVHELNVRYIPPLEYRATDYPCHRDADFAVRNKFNGTQTRLDDERGGKISYHHFVHTFNAILSPDKHFKEHPEYFSMIKGKRVGGRTQLCLTNPDVLRIAKKIVRRWIAERPDATIFSVSQNDWHNYCRCPKCAALAKKEGSQAGPLIHFVNAIADDIAKDYPDKIISTLAYQYTRKPPKHVKPRPNVTVRLCSIECCFSHPLATCDYNRSFVDDIKGWGKICRRLSIWDYVIDYHHSVMPFPNLYVLKPNIRFFIRHGATSIYEEACYFTKGSELAELRTWIMAKTLWDPKYDTDKAIDEFVSGYYGPAGEFIRRYIDLMHKQVAGHKDWHMTIWSKPTSPWLNAAAIAESVKLFDRAEAAVKDDPTLLHRVRVARMPVQYVRIMTASRGWRQRGDVLASVAGPEVTKLTDRLEATARKAGLTMVREHRAYGALDRWLARVRKTGKTLRLVRLTDDKLELAVLPALGGRIWRIVHKPTGRDVLKRYRAGDGAELPDAGGYEEYSQGDYRTPGWNERYRVVRSGKTSVTVEAKLSNGLRLRRTIRLAGGKAGVEIRSTLTNPGKKAVRACLRAHPAFAVKDVAKAAVLIHRPKKPPKRMPLALPKGGPQEKDVWLRGEDMPAGQWTLVDAASGLAIVCRFEAKQVVQCLLNRSAPHGRVNLELYTKETALPPGKSLELAHSIEVRKATREELGNSKK